MLDMDLATLYEVETKVLNQAVKRNYKRFPGDFMFRLTIVEWNTMRSQFVTAYLLVALSSQFVMTSYRQNLIISRPLLRPLPADFHSAFPSVR